MVEGRARAPVFWQFNWLNKPVLACRALGHVSAAREEVQLALCWNIEAIDHVQHIIRVKQTELTTVLEW